MLELTAENVLGYLRATGRLDESTPATVVPLAWGVSNLVLRIEPAGGRHFVLKQSRRQLQTQAAWYSRLDRICREMDVMRALATLLPTGAVPHILFEDRENYLFGMQAVPADHVVWKAELLSGRADRQIALQAADYLAVIHRQSFDDEALRDQFRDRTVFDELRIDPFYRRIADVHPQIAPAISRLIDEMLATTICLVHADFSPKNVLIVRDVRDSSAAAGRLTLVDFETAHFGDPAFDLGFFFSHLLLKTVLHADRAAEFLDLARRFRARYFQTAGDPSNGGAMSRMELERRTVLHLAACMLARIDGKSTIDYLNDPADLDLVRRFCLDLLLDPAESLDAAFDRINEMLELRRRTD